MSTPSWYFVGTSGGTLVTSRNPDFDQLFLEHYDRLVRSLTAITGDREIARDSVQDAFVKASARWRKVSRYDDPVGWIRRVAIHRSRDIHRAETRRRRREERANPLASDHEPDRAPAVDGSLRIADLLRCLPDRQRDVAGLFYVEDLSVAEIANSLGISAGAVKFHLNRARAALRQAVEQEAVDQEAHYG
jgi:RNA polymerase sigma-70 factor, ECF subfamily